MTEPGASLCFQRPDGTPAEATVVACHDDPWPAEPPLRSCLLTLEHADGGREEVRHLAPLPGEAAGYDALDNEILAGLRLSRLCRSRPYPPAVSRLVGYEADGTHPFALLAPYRGRPLAGAAKILPGEKMRFQESLLTGARWISAAGLAHRGISPYTVFWDGMSVQITDFRDAAPIGAPRTVSGAPPWQAPEQRPGMAAGMVSDKDDVWALGRLIFYVITGRELVRPEQLHAEPDLAALLQDVFGPMEGRPSVRDLLDRLNLADPLPRPPAPDVLFQQGQADFFAIRAQKHPGTAARQRVEPPGRPAEPDPPAPPPRRRWWGLAR